MNWSWWFLWAVIALSVDLYCIVRGFLEIGVFEK